ncbi:MAG TPA: hypothetical protein PLP98_10885, partial [Plasticicumulans sp.]|nr:hypothetical protein [Plasticicumulans sp.]
QGKRSALPLPASLAQQQTKLTMAARSLHAGGRIGSQAKAVAGSPDLRTPARTRRRQRQAGRRQTSAVAMRGFSGC